jgi:hypothetical protein
VKAEREVVVFVYKVAAVVAEVARGGEKVFGLLFLLVCLR